MSTYIDGFVIPVPRDKIDAYRAVAEVAAKVWKEHGALEYVEGIGDDMNARDMVSFPELAKTTADEAVIFAWITYRSKADRDIVNQKALKDPRIQAFCRAKDQPFDCHRMAYGGFEMMVRA